MIKDNRHEYWMYSYWIGGAHTSRIEQMTGCIHSIK